MPKIFYCQTFFYYKYDKYSLVKPIVTKFPIQLTHKHSVFVRVSSIFYDWYNVSSLLCHIDQIPAWTMRELHCIYQTLLYIHSNSDKVIPQSLATNFPLWQKEWKDEAKHFSPSFTNPHLYKAFQGTRRRTRNMIIYLTYYYLVG